MNVLVSFFGGIMGFYVILWAIIKLPREVRVLRYTIRHWRSHEVLTPEQAQEFHETVGAIRRGERQRCS